MKRLLATTVAAVALVSACGVAADETAATVDGTDISTSEVADLASTSFVADIAQQQGIGLVSSPKGTTGSAKQRVALGIIVQTVILERAVEDRGGRVTEDDRASAEQQIAQTEQQTAQAGAESGLEPRVRKLLLRYTAAQNAIVRLDGGGESEPVTDADIDAYFEEHSDEFVTQTCLDGFAVQAADASTAQGLVDGGATVEAVLSDASLQAQPLTQDGSEACVPVGQVADPALRQVVDEGPVGRWSTVNLDDPSAGPMTVFIFPNSREQPTSQTPSVRQEIAATLEQEAQSAQSDDITATLRDALEGADVEIDPRYGSWNPSGSVVDAPSSPKAAVSAADEPIAIGGQ